MQKIKKAINWLVYSSTNPEKFSMTVKGIGLWVITMLVASSSITHVQWSSPELSTALDQSLVAINSGFAFISSLWILYGSVRKIILTVEGRNTTF